MARSGLAGRRPLTMEVHEFVLPDALIAVARA
jgi:hypothetical protein